MKKFLLFIITLTLAFSENKILVINSNNSIEKYNSIENEFEKVFKSKFDKINLSDKSWSPKKVEEFLYDEYPDIVYTIGSKAYLLANKYISEKKVIFSSIMNWQRLPLTKNSYGVSNELYSGMKLMLFKHLFPNIKKIGILYSKYTGELIEEIDKISKEMDIEIVSKKISKRDNIKSKLKELTSEVDAFWLIPEPVLMSNRENVENVFTICNETKTAIFSYDEIFIKYGAILVTSIDEPTIARQVSSIIEDIVAGESIEERVQYPLGSHIILNLKKAKEYNLKYNEDALYSVNQIVE